MNLKQTYTINFTTLSVEYNHLLLKRQIADNLAVGHILADLAPTRQPPVQSLRSRRIEGVSGSLTSFNVMPERFCQCRRHCTQSGRMFAQSRQFDSRRGRGRAKAPLRHSFSNRAQQKLPCSLTTSPAPAAIPTSRVVMGRERNLCPRRIHHPCLVGRLR